jgi:hypothetical protein
MPLQNLGSGFTNLVFLHFENISFLIICSDFLKVENKNTSTKHAVVKEIVKFFLIRKFGMMSHL